MMDFEILCESYKGWLLCLTVFCCPLSGPYLITRVYERHCRQGGKETTLHAMDHCKSLTVLEPRALCPVFMFNNQVRLMPSLDVRQSGGMRIWDSNTRN
jgi:hypothetical protein